MNRHNFFVLLLWALCAAGCSDSQIQDDALGAFVHVSKLDRACRMPLENIKYTHLEKHTAGKLNDRAYIVGISFVCANSVTGRTPWDLYVGYVPNRQGGSNCVAWNGDLSRLRNGMSWLACGGLNLSDAPASDDSQNRGSAQSTRSAGPAPAQTWEEKQAETLQRLRKAGEEENARAGMPLK